MKDVVDRFTLVLLAVIVAAGLLPCRGEVALVLDRLATFGVALLFFLHGARLSREAIVAGAMHWRLHLTVLACTFGLFPLLGLISRPLLASMLAPPLAMGFLYLCALPSTVQSSIAFTSIARGNVAAAVCSASASNLLGVFVTPLLAGLLLSRGTGTASLLQAIGDIVLQLLLPFVAGHLLRPWIGAAVARWKPVLSLTDRGTILLVVYVAFSEATTSGMWRQIPPAMLAGLVLAAASLLTLVLATTWWLSRRLGFNTEDRIAILFCGSKKSLATGIPMARILFTGHPSLGMIVLPVIVFHQLQLIACAWLAQRFSRRPPA